MPISAKILANSINTRGERITTFEIELPKVLLAEFGTHRVISKNFSSSRAIPTKAFNEADSFEPLYWGANQSGMVAKSEEILEKEYARAIWLSHVDSCKETSKKLADLGLHKQWSNRMNDWHVMAKGVCTATEWGNFFKLRNHPDAQPEIHELARLMRIEMNTAPPPEQLSHGEWHLPYIDVSRDSKDRIVYSTEIDGVLSLDDAKMISASCCAQVSYRKNDTSLEKARAIFDMLNIGKQDKIPHFSPLEHQATPIPEIPSFGRGVTHIDRNAKFWSANFCGWVQYRQEVMDQDGIVCLG